MKQNSCQQQQEILCVDEIKTTPLFAGVNLAYISFFGDRLSVKHKKAPNILVINYCENGRIGWKTESGNYVYLGAGDFSVHMMDLCANSEINLPNGSYEGIAIYIDLEELADNPPELLRGSGITGSALCERLCKKDMFLSVTGNEQTDAIFRFFFHQAESVRLSYQKIKVLELLLYLYKTEDFSNQCETEYKADQIEIIRKIHEQLLDSLDKRITIEELSRQYLMNPTTMKALFKSVYGTSIAAHMKEHRMRKAAELLLETEISIAEIAISVGYDSQSKFSTAFKDFFQMLPKEYRKKR